MRILETTTTIGMGGISRHMIDLGEWLRARGHHVAYAGTDGGMLEGSDADYLPVPLDRISAEGGALARRVSAAPACALQLREFIRAQGVDLIHAHESAPALAVRLADPAGRIPLALTYHGSEPERVRSFALVARATARLVITPSRSTADHLAEAGVPRERLRVIGLGVRDLPPGDEARTAELRRSLLGAGAARLVVSIVRLTHQKGIDILIETVRRTKAERPDIRFVVVGDGPQREEARRWAQDAEVADTIAFVGESRNVADYLRAADLFLLSSRWEALPITIVEAFRAGAPVIATDCGGVAEIVDDGVGRVVPVHDPQALATAVLDFCGDDERRRQAGAAALARSREDRFSPDWIHSQFERTYEELIAAASPGRRVRHASNA